MLLEYAFFARQLTVLSMTFCHRTGHQVNAEYKAKVYLKGISTTNINATYGYG